MSAVDFIMTAFKWGGHATLAIVVIHWLRKGR